MNIADDAKWLERLIPGIQRNIVLSVTSSAEAIEKWKTMPELDAWITYESWHNRMKDTTSLVRLPLREKLYRGTPIAITSITDERELAQEFVKFLQSGQGHAVFRKWGWK